ncbi:MAG: MarR family transcriptional regulator [Gordonia sp. (in: high G+C Gram-positive bacteria)]|uniref:MarR family winged helix-turn-helix transcriptional regulator n=1 Tax=Gordonia sp. (in: high G+C Gram-positive bacteria) TaxID=84139 RepID=UPI0039E68808
MASPQPGDTPSVDCYWHQWQALIRSGEVLWAAVTRRVAKVTDLAPAEWRVLDMIGCTGSMRISDVAELTQIGMSTVSRQVNKLIDQGYLQVCDEQPEDGRQKWVRLTAEGRAELTPIQQARDGAVRELMMDQMSPSEWSSLCASFERFRLRAEQELAED